MPDPNLRAVSLTFRTVFGETAGDDVFLSIPEWKHPVTYFVGRNGTGKSRAAQILSEQLEGLRLSTDRLVGLMNFTNYGWTSVPAQDGYRGVPLSDAERKQAEGFGKRAGSGIRSLYILDEEPEVALEVAAFIRRALGRVVLLKEKAGFLDPVVRINEIEYSLFRDEGHGLRELVILLAAVYRRDWKLLVVDEPELHLHPSMTRLWLGEVERVCSRDNRHAVIVTHEPSLVRPRVAEHLESIYYFSIGNPAIRFSDASAQAKENQVTASLQHNPELISSLVFSPRPVLVEGIHDIAALTTSLGRTQPTEVVAQTDFVGCGGDGAVAAWFEIARNLNIDICAVGDLDACLDTGVRRVMDRSAVIQERYRDDLSAEPPTTATVIKPLQDEMRAASVPPNSKDRAIWLSNPPPGTGHATRVQKLIKIWRDAGFWLHPQGTLEAVLRIPEKGKGNAQQAAEAPGPIDDVANWCAYKLDTAGDVRHLLGIAVERIAHGIMEALLDTPDARFNAVAGGSDDRDNRLVSVQPVGDGKHRITVKLPEEFRGYWLEFSRQTPSTDLTLSTPTEGHDAGSSPPAPSTA